MNWNNAKDSPPTVTAGYIIAVEDGRGNKWTIPGIYSLEMKTWFGEFGEIKNEVTHWTTFPNPPGSMTNEDWIRTLSTDDMVKLFLSNFCPIGEKCRSYLTCEECWSNWLKKKAEDI